MKKIQYIEYAEPVPDYQLFLTPNDLQSNQWNLDKIQAPLAWNITTGSSNVTIAMVDDAVLLSHEDLAPVIWINSGEIAGNSLDDDGNGYVDDINGWDAADGDNNPSPPYTATNSDFTHGTHTSGIAAAATNNGLGIASISYNVKLMAVKTKTDASSGPTLQAPYLGVEYAIAAGANVISMSWGGGAYSQTYQNLFDLANSQGIVLIAAAGNSNTSIPMYPAAYNHVISVGATDNQDVKSSFSNYGSSIDLMAPGSSIWSALAGGNSSYGYLSGTSMACPLVSGLAALMLSKISILTPDEIESCLKSSCDNIDALNSSFAGQLGAGRINAYGALLCAKPISALFTSNYSQVCPGGIVQFSDQSTNNPISWQWNFTGGTPSSSAIQNPVVQYSSSGNYSVTLIVTNSLGTDTIIKNNYITVALPTAIVSGSATVNAGFPVNLPIILTGNPPWTIIYTDGSTNFTIANIPNSPYYLTVAPLVNTTYSLLSVSDNGCAGNASGSAIITVTFQNNPFCLNIKSVQKISDTQGNFSGVLDDWDYFGVDVISMGDHDGDSINDISIGTTWDDDGGTDMGAVWNLFLNSNGTVKSAQKISATQGNFTGTLSTDNRFGGRLNMIGDIDKDGVNDMAVGALYDDDGGTNRGAVWILFLNSNGTVKSFQKISDTQGNFSGVLDNNDCFGHSVASVGDMDGDSNSDIVVGAAYDDDGGTDHGALWVLFLNTNGTVKSYQKISSTQGGFNGTLSTLERFGYYLNSIGDFDSDGIADIIVGAPGDNDGGSERGAVWLLFLNSNGTVKSNKKISNIIGNFTGNLDNLDKFGTSVSPVGDLDKDGVTDIIVGAINDDDGGTDKGAAWILLLNNDGTVKADYKISDTQGNFPGILDNSDNFGNGVSFLNDIDGDGFSDIVIGSNGDDDGGTDRGAVWIIFLEDTCLGSTDPFCFNLKTPQKISDTQGNFTGILDNTDIFGGDVASLGDLDGDGISDIAAGAMWDDDGGTDFGSIWILFLNQDATVKSYQKISAIQGNFTGTLTVDDRFGYCIANIGDLDNDAIADIAIGAYYDDDGGLNRGAVWILFLNQDGTVKSYQKISDTQGNFTGILNDNDAFGHEISSIGDIDNDGITDIAVSAQLDDDGGTDCGAVWILFLNSNGTVKAFQKISNLQGNLGNIISADDRFGYGISTVGDLDNDGIPDIAVGAPQDDDGGADLGAVWILFLNNNGTVKSSQKISQTSGNFSGIIATGDAFGCSFAPAGDMDGDMTPDLAVGAASDDDGGLTRGSIWLLFLNSNGTVKNHYKISSTQGGFTGTLDNGDEFGLGIGNIGDFDGNGITDFAVGARRDDDGGTDRGAVWFLFPEDTCSPSVVPPPPCSITADFLTDTVCISDSASFFDISTDSSANIIIWRWYFGDGDSLWGDNNPKHLYPAADTFMVTLIVGNGDSIPCFDTVVKPVIVLDTNTVFTPPDDTICFGDSVSLGPLNIVCAKPPYTYIWFPPAGLSGTDVANPKASPLATTAYYVTVTDSAGVVATDSITITVNTSCCRSYAIVGANGYYCYGDPVTFQNNSIARPGAIFNWNFGLYATPSSYAGTTPPPVFFDTNGIIRIRLIVNDSCGSDTGFYTVNIYPPPYVYAGNDTTLCFNDTLQLGTTPVSGYIYQWTPGSGISNDSIANPLVFVNNSVTYFLKVLNTETNCSSYDSVTVTLMVTAPNILVTASDTTIPGGSSTIISASGGTTYLWSNGAINSSVTVTPSATTTYSVTVTNSAGCSASDSIKIIVIPCSNPFIPSAFSPNGDDYNDMLYIRGFTDDCFTSMTFFVYSRWGQLVWETTSASKGWDGSFNGKPLNAGVFVYYLKVTWLNGEEEMLKGNITLLK